MSRGDLERIQHAARYGRILVSPHARDRMAERNASAHDVKNAVLISTVAIHQVDRYRLEGGSDLDGVALTVVVREIQPGLWLISVFGGG